MRRGPERLARSLAVGLGQMNDRAVYPLGRRRTLVVLAGTLLGMFLASVSQSLAATVLPRIVGELGGVESYSWVFSAYVLGVTLTIPLYGKLSDVHGRRPLFAAAILLFGAGSIVAALAVSMPMLVAGRAVQGIGAGGLIPLGIAVIGDIIAPRARGRWLALNGFVFATAAVAGPLLGGLIADRASWRLAFALTVPLAAVALVVIWKGFGSSGERRRQRIDVVGATLLVAGSCAGLFALSTAGVEWPWSSAPVIALLAVAVALLAAFALWERRIAEPFLPLGLYTNRAVAGAQLALLGLGAAAVGTVALLPLFVQGALGESATRAGAALTPLLLAWIVTGVVAGQIVSRTGRPRPVLLGGPPLLAAGFVLLAALDAASSLADVTVAVVVLGAGAGLMMQTLVIVVQNAAPRELVGVATASAQFSRWVGATAGVTVMGAVAATHVAGAGPGGATPVEIASALHGAFLAGLGMAALALVGVLFLPRVVLRERFDERAELASPATAR